MATGRAFVGFRERTQMEPDVARPLEVFMPEPRAILDVPLSRNEIRGFYGAASRQYDDMTARYEAKPKAAALQRMARHPGERYLEVAVGTGVSIVEQVSQTGAEGVVGIDLTRPMVALTRERLAAAGAAQVPLLLADARHLPFSNATFDCLFNSYMLDLIPTAEIPVILAEFRRVLKRGGRLVLANLTEGQGKDAGFSVAWKERFLADPIRLGGCRPVMASDMVKAAGFVRVQRSYIGGESWPTEIVSAQAGRR
jgi:demethylmenaquinone methyltransferase/2-methoxy-6-polyprenyl-1,4-benzoquinol methylase